MRGIVRGTVSGIVARIRLGHVLVPRVGNDGRRLRRRHLVGFVRSVDGRGGRRRRRLEEGRIEAGVIGCHVTSEEGFRLERRPNDGFLRVRENSRFIWQSTPLEVKSKSHRVKDRKDQVRTSALGSPRRSRFGWSYLNEVVLSVKVAREDVLVLDAVHGVPGVHQEAREARRPKVAKLLRRPAHNAAHVLRHFAVVVFLQQKSSVQSFLHLLTLWYNLGQLAKECRQKLS